MVDSISDKKYNVIYADPPWSYTDKRESSGPKGNSAGSAAQHYQTMSLTDIRALPVAEIAADPCLLFMWATWPLLPQWLPVMEAWGFQYKTLGFDWVKQYPKSGKICMGAGAYTRSNSEVCLIGVRGKGASLILDHSVRNVQMAPRAKHSVKPQLFRDLIVQLVGDVPRMELFARNRTEGWDVWGNETDKFAPEQSPASSDAAPSSLDVDSLVDVDMDS